MQRLFTTLSVSYQTTYGSELILKYMSTLFYYPDRTILLFFRAYPDWRWFTFLNIMNFPAAKAMTDVNAFPQILDHLIKNWWTWKSLVGLEKLSRSYCFLKRLLIRRKWLRSLHSWFGNTLTQMPKDNTQWYNLF